MLRPHIPTGRILFTCYEANRLRITCRTCQAASSRDTFVTPSETCEPTSTLNREMTMRSPQSIGRRESVKFGGLGIIDVDRDVYYDREYSVWYDMLVRCHAPKRALNPKLSSYEGCSIDESFRRYSDFHAWLSSRWIPTGNLDKDIKLRGNKVYGADTCLVVSSRVNKAFQLKRRTGNLPYGVKVRPGGKFAAYGFDLDGSTHARNFPNVAIAHRYWQESKAKLLTYLAEFESEEAKPFILDRAETLLIDAMHGRVTGEFL